jgi:hypothetical protein
MEADMFVVRGTRGQITAAYLDEQFPGQEFLPIHSRSLQLFLVAAPSCCSMRRRESEPRVARA